jgi:hypothetical protein
MSHAKGRAEIIGIRPIRSHARFTSVGKSHATIAVPPDFLRSGLGYPKFVYTSLTILAKARPYKLAV